MAVTNVTPAALEGSETKKRIAKMFNPEERTERVNLMLTSQEAEALIQMFLLNSLEMDEYVESLLARKIRDLSQALERKVPAGCSR